MQESREITILFFTTLANLDIQNKCVKVLKKKRNEYEIVFYENEVCDYLANNDPNYIDMSYKRKI